MKNLFEKISTNGHVFLCTVLAVFLLTIVPAGAKAQSPHPVDRWIDNCIAQDSSTMGMLSCLDEGYNRWDNELNYVYQSLRALLNQQQKEALKKAQRAWIIYRDAEFEAMNLIYGSLDGTMWRLASMSAKVEMVKARTLELSMYVESLQQGR